MLMHCHILVMQLLAVVRSLPLSWSMSPERFYIGVQLSSLVKQYLKAKPVHVLCGSYAVPACDTQGTCITSLESVPWLLWTVVRVARL